jgi:hypothetical protein
MKIKDLCNFAVLLTITTACVRCDNATSHENQGSFLSYDEIFSYVTFVDTTIIDSGSIELKSVPKVFISTSWKTRFDDTAMTQMPFDSVLFPSDFYSFWRKRDTVRYLGHTFTMHDTAEFKRLENAKPIEEEKSKKEIIENIGPIYMSKSNEGLSIEFSYLVSRHMMYWGMKLPNSEFPTAKAITEDQKERYSKCDSLRALSPDKAIACARNQYSIDTTTIYSGKLFFR